MKLDILKKIFGQEKKQEKIEKRTLMNLKVGDIVIYYETDYQVFAVIDWVEEGYTWKEYKLKNKDEVYWVCAEVDDGELIAGFYHMVKDFKVEKPYPDSIEYEGIKFELEEKGKAVGRITSEAGEQNYQCFYHDYLSEDEKKFFSIEVFGEEIEISEGEVLRPSEINILPGG